MTSNDYLLTIEVQRTALAIGQKLAIASIVLVKKGDVEVQKQDGSVGFPKLYGHGELGT